MSPGRLHQGENDETTLDHPAAGCGLMALPGLGSAETPAAETVVERAISAVETKSTLAQHDMLRLAIHDDETASDGTNKTKDLTAIIHGGRTGEHPL